MARLVQSKKWYNVELNKEDSERLKKFLRGYGAKFETSAAYNLIHFEILCDLYDLKVIDDFLKNME